MDIAELTDQEVLSMVVLAKHLVHIDQELSQAEMLDLMSLGEAIGMSRFMAALDASKDHYKNMAAVVWMADQVVRFDARVLIFVLLEELAKGDGVGDRETAFIKDLRAHWQL